MTLQKVASRPQRGWRLLAIAMVASSAFMPPPAAARVLSRSPHASPAGTHGTASLLVHTMPGTTRAQVTVSTLLFVPGGRAPLGGWPIVAWAHGSTTPGSRRCAPSLSPDFDGGLTASGAKSDYGDEIASLVNAGYAVVAPDYEGLGAAAESPNPGFNSRSIANALLSGIRAARSVEHDLSNQYLTVGHSDGARALLAFDQLARHEAGLQHRGTVALAPFTSMRALIRIAGQRTAQGGDQVPAITAQNFIVAAVATGLKVQSPQFDERQIMGADLAAVFPTLKNLCGIPANKAVMDAVKHKGAANFRGILPGWADAPRMKRFLQANDPAEMPGLTIRHPMLIVAGTNDDFVPVEPLRKLVAAQRTLGAPITLVLQPGGNHFSIIKGRRDDVMRFIAKMFSDLPAKASR